MKSYPIEEFKLELFIITYNRVDSLRKTLDFLSESILKAFRITVLDNASNDATAEVCSWYKQKIVNLNVVSHKINIGAGANFLRAFELSESIYTWVLADDDLIDLKYFDDVLEVISDELVDLIHVGAHAQKDWALCSGHNTPKQLLAKGYPYFKFSSFVPCNIFKTSCFASEFMIPAYNNVLNSYPHMPYVFSIFSKNKRMYVSKQQIVFAGENERSYTTTQWFYWWMRTCELLSDSMDVRSAFLDQWKNIGESNIKLGLKDFHDFKWYQNDDDYIKRFIKKYFSLQERKHLLKLDLIAFIKQKQYGVKRRLSKLKR